MTRTSSIVVIGGTGFLGRRAVGSLRRAGYDVVVAGRSPERGGVTVDPGRPETFTALEGFSVVVNASSSHGAPPDELAAFCLAREMVLVECSSDRVVVERLLRRRGEPAKGTVVLGAGIFTGLSNLLAADAVRAARAGGDGDVSVEIGICSSPFSGAGAGTIDLMLDAMQEPAVTVRSGVANAIAATRPGPTLPFPGGRRRTLTFSFPEVPMLAASTGARDVVLGFAPAPAVLWPSFRWMPAALLGSRLFRVALGAYFRVLRGWILRDVASRVELVARARCGGREVTRGLIADDGFAVAGAAIAATAIRLAEACPTGCGVVTIDEIMTLEDILPGTTRLADGLQVV